ncbi:hypothetical protein DYBT9275_00023 [Dyadobacter sp. CECT 9275]|uniref:Peptidase M12B domain-containing protein n=2 Tax=Dyadobacter helix TaxID=2822344 RepID=A0A916J7P4_9BACT|nr:zinc-dependent metalloprotease [Dyadobacter sp. CECT 9275]CAG4988185.1 hypothetical protein DYBT9275_00023 [Dyadobacter sp. CECT 9275]
MIRFSTFKFIFIFVLIGWIKNAYAQQGIPNCGTLDSTVSAYLSKFTKTKDLTKARVAAGEKLEYRLALDINYGTYLMYNGDKELLTRTAYRFIEDASAIFERDINVKLTVTSILIWDHPEPYQLQNDFDYYGNVLNYWENNRFEPRDAVVSLSVRYGWFYGGYRMCSSNFPEPNNPGLAVDLLCHELGHTLGSPHTHYCGWPDGPIDYCNILETNDPECTSDYIEYVNGSLMSYCRTVLRFHPYCQNLMRDYAEGNLNPYFKLNPVNAALSDPGTLRLKEPDPQLVSNTPSFEWNAPVGVEQYRIQIAKDADFTQLTEDTLVKQSYFRSAGQGEGNYFARFRASSQVGNSSWSEAVAFTIPSYSDNSTPPVLMNPLLFNGGTFTGYFYKYPGIESYQLEVKNIYIPDQIYLHELKTTEAKVQSFRLPIYGDIYGRYEIRLRVRKNEVWSTWSKLSYMYPAWNSEIWRFNNLSKITDKPLLAVNLYQPSLHNGMLSSMEIARDAAFKNVVFKDSLLSNDLNDWQTNKATFQPTLDANSSYFVRTRILFQPGVYSNWNVSQLTTGQQDQRFEYLGLVSKNLQSTNYAFGDFLRNRFYKSGDKLYVSALGSGYYATSDLKTWQPFITSTTRGKSPNIFNLFGASENGDTYVLDQNNAVVRNSGGNYEKFFSNGSFYLYEYNSIATTKNDGIFFKTDNQGVANLKDGIWTFYDQSVLFSARPLYVAANANDQVYAVMDGGYVWSFQNGRWKQEPYMFQWQGVRGIAFDQNQACYLYGDWGVAKLNQQQGTWDMIQPVSGYPVRKVTFDKDNQMWIAAYRNDGQNYQYYGLIKLKDQKMNIYTDGLGFLKEPFDLEIFNNKVLILTAGGEIHSFDENKIQRFDGKTSYCVGEELGVTITSNSTFGRDNQAGLRLVHTESNAVTTLTGQQTGNEIKAVLPLTLAEGTYRVSTVTTQPELLSNESATFRIYAQAPAVLTKAETSRFKTKLVASTGQGLTYQWYLNGNEILGENSATLEVSQSGEYTVMVSNEGGCKTKSNAVTVETDEPAEITLLQNMPNPVNTTTEIAFYLPQAEEVSLDYYNVRGQKMGQLKKGSFPKGWHFASVDGKTIPAGVYIYSLKAGKYTKSLKMLKL